MTEKFINANYNKEIQFWFSKIFFIYFWKNSPPIVSPPYSGKNDFNQLKSTLSQIVFFNQMVIEKVKIIMLTIFQKL